MKNGDAAYPYKHCISVFSYSKQKTYSKDYPQREAPQFLHVRHPS